MRRQDERVSNQDPFTQSRQALLQLEAELAEQFVSSAGPLLDLVDDACALLMAVLLSAPAGTTSIELDEEGAVVGGDVPALHLLAQVTLGVRGLRVIRAGRATLVYGWEPEARAQDRVLVELAAHRSAILSDASGTEAIAWLARERVRGISARVRAMAPGDLYANLSSDSHGDPAPVGRLLNPETGEMQIEPRRSGATRASLWLYAGFARDQAVVTARAAGITLRGVDDFDAAMEKARIALEAEHDDLDRPSAS